MNIGFEIELGLRQGCLLSPILFALFINDLVDEIQKLNLGIQCGLKKISLLLFADDIVVIAESRKDLEKMLTVIYDFSLKWRFKFNYDKCAMVIFDNKEFPNVQYGKCDGNCNCGFHVQFGPNLIKEVGIYKYLGVELDKKLSFKDFKTRLLDKAKRSLSKIWYMVIKSGYLSIKASLNLWETLVRCQLEYGAEIWGKVKWNEAGTVQMDMCRRILRCPSRTTKLALQGDLGLWSLHGRRDFKKLSWWINVITLDSSRLVKQMYKHSKDFGKKSTWTGMIKGILDKYGLTFLWQDEKKIYDVKSKTMITNPQRHQSKDIGRIISEK